MAMNEYQKSALGGGGVVRPSDYDSLQPPRSEPTLRDITRNGGEISGRASVLLGALCELNDRLAGPRPRVAAGGEKVDKPVGALADMHDTQIITMQTLTALEFELNQLAGHLGQGS